MAFVLINLVCTYRLLPVAIWNTNTGNIEAWECDAGGTPCTLKSEINVADQVPPLATSQRESENNAGDLPESESSTDFSNAQTGFNRIPGINDKASSLTGDVENALLPIAREAQNEIRGGGLASADAVKAGRNAALAAKKDGASDQEQEEAAKTAIFQVVKEEAGQ